VETVKLRYPNTQKTPLTAAPLPHGERGSAIGSNPEDR